MCSSIPNPKLPYNIKLIDTLIGKVFLSEFVLLDLQASLQEFLGLISTDSHVHRDLLVPLNTEGSDCVAGLGLDGNLLCQVLEHFGSLGKSISTLTHTAVDDKFLDFDLTHLVGVLVSLLYLLSRHILLINNNGVAVFT